MGSSRSQSRHLLCIISCFQAVLYWNVVTTVPDSMLRFLCAFQVPQAELIWLSYHITCPWYTKIYRFYHSHTEAFRKNLKDSEVFEHSSNDPHLSVCLSILPPLHKKKRLHGVLFCIVYMPIKAYIYNDLHVMLDVLP